MKKANIAKQLCLLAFCAFLVLATLRAQTEGGGSDTGASTTTTNATAAGNTTAPANCTEGQALCLHTCYDVLNQTCVQNTTICPLNSTELCGESCYNSTLMTCHDNKILCGLNETLCGFICVGDQQLCKDLSFACSADDWLCRRTALFIERFFEQILLIIRSVWNTVRAWDWMDLYGQYTRLFTEAEKPPQEGEAPSDIEQPAGNATTNATTTTGNRCDGHRCPSGEICCDDVLVGPLCYVPGQHTCTSVGNNQTRYCCCPTCLPCGADYRCYKTETHQCVNGIVMPLPEASPAPQPSPSPAPSPSPQPSPETPASDVIEEPQPAPSPSPAPAPQPSPSPAPQPSPETPPAEEQPAPQPSPSSAPQPSPAPAPQPSPSPAPQPSPQPEQPQQPTNKCDGYNCPSGEVCCDDILVGPLCYTPGQHTCTPVGNNQTRYCCCATCLPCGEDYRCYRTETHQCVNGVVVPLPEASPETPPPADIEPQPSPSPAPSPAPQPSPSPAPQPSPSPSPAPSPAPSPSPQPPTCSAGFAGPNCDIPLCFSQQANDLNVCNGHGQCVAPDNCTCSQGWSGDRCDVRTCEAGFTGSNCEFPVCFSISANDSSVCSGNGRCVSPDQCQCNQGFTGARCESRANRCDTTQCSAGEVCCDDLMVGPLCYVPGQHTCTPVGNNQTRYCCCATCLPCGEDYRCYKTETHQCVNGQVVPLENTSTTETGSTTTSNNSTTETGSSSNSGSAEGASNSEQEQQGSTSDASNTGSSASEEQQQQQ